MIPPKVLATLAAVGSYVLIVLLLFFTFNRHDRTLRRHYVTRNSAKSPSIAVTLAGPPPRSAKSKAAPRKHPLKASKGVRKTVPRNIHSRRSRPALKHVHRAPKAKRIPTRSLFASVKVPGSRNKPSSRTSKSPTPKTGAKSLRTRQKERGIEHAYFAKVERLLRGWPAQANFAGETISVRLKIYRDGRFDYRILQRSSNPEFNAALERYLKQLQSIGFGPHDHPKPYDIQVKFVAHE